MTNTHFTGTFKELCEVCLLPFYPKTLPSTVLRKNWANGILKDEINKAPLNVHGLNYDHSFNGYKVNLFGTQRLFPYELIRGCSMHLRMSPLILYSTLLQGVHRTPHQQVRATFPNHSLMIYTGDLVFWKRHQRQITLELQWKGPYKSLLAQYQKSRVLIFRLMFTSSNEMQHFLLTTGCPFHWKC